MSSASDELVAKWHYLYSGYCRICYELNTRCKCPPAYKTTPYYDGQADALAWLTGDIASDDEPFAPIHPELTTEYALWCLGLNLSVAGGLKKAELNGKSQATEWNRTYRGRWK